VFQNKLPVLRKTFEVRRDGVATVQFLDVAVKQSVRGSEGKSRGS
jgi:hypothetical protein